MNALISTTTTPAGPFTVIVADTDGRPVIASGWTADRDALLPQVAAALRPERLQTVRRIDGITQAIHDYQDGATSAIDSVVVHQQSGPYFAAAWQVLRGVEAGHPVSYTEFAALTGRPAAVRAAAGACAANAAALFVPCHRVLRTDGSLGGFRWGLSVKRWLLDHEAQHPAGSAHAGLIAG